MSAALCNARSPLPMRQEFLMFKAEKIIFRMCLAQQSKNGRGTFGAWAMVILHYRGQHSSDVARNEQYLLKSPFILNG